VKLSKKMISGDTTDLLNDGKVPVFLDGVNMWYVRLFVVAISSRLLRVATLSSTRGSYPPARTSLQFFSAAVVALNAANACIAKATFFFRSKRLSDRKVGRSE